ncbi:hypothetical protein OUZ56_006946 [Daphnia magna]|uniref:Uncharacterized protein n=1 Tax=Daphnia magna TaxID=35525 RepID=A0ABQ9YXA4_9CRUS|nr:hypothetical protein OUZ56_006946 [Daphnia magna]
MEKVHGLESWGAHSCSGTFSSVQATNNVRQIYPHQTWSLFWLIDLFPVRPKFFPLPAIIVRVREADAQPGEILDTLLHVVNTISDRTKVRKGMEFPPN